jgi:hypothetical protein
MNTNVPVISSFDVHVAQRFLVIEADLYKFLDRLSC